MRCRLAALAALILFAAPLSLAAPFSLKALAEPGGYDLVLDAAIPMRDGVRLHANLYLPERGSASEKVPTLVSMTPYGIDGFHREAASLARRGFAVALVDVRGRGGPAFEPWVHDGRDGHDVVEWLARQPWSTGKVGMFGHSYGGRAVWSTLKEAPPHLTAAVPIAPSCGMEGWKNILSPDMMQWIALTTGSNIRLATDSDFWTSKFRQLYLDLRPFAELDEVVGAASPLFQHFLAHPALDTYWQRITPRPADFARIRVPVLTVAGQYDGGASPALWYYREHLRNAGAAARHQLLLGPWDHGGAMRPAREAGGLDLGEASRIDLMSLLADWFAAELSGAAKPAFLAPPVRYYFLGPNEWREAPSLEAASAPPRRFYLGSDGAAGSLTRPGRLSETRTGSARSDGWVHDPLDLRPGRVELENELWASRFDLPDDLWGSGLAYATEPFATKVLLSGQTRLALWLAIDAPDADFTVRLDLVAADGELVFLGQDWLRARYRTSLEREEKIPPGVPLEYPFELGFAARELPAGSRLRLIVSSPNSIFQQRNFNGGGEVAHESARDARTVHVKLLHDAEHPSRLELPLR